MAEAGAATGMPHKSAKWTSGYNGIAATDAIAFDQFPETGQMNGSKIWNGIERNTTENPANRSCAVAAAVPMLEKGYIRNPACGLRLTKLASAIRANGSTPDNNV